MLRKALVMFLKTFYMFLFHKPSLALCFFKILVLT
jgi:hypothetical protein